MNILEGFELKFQQYSNAGNESSLLELFWEKLVISLITKATVQIHKLRGNPWSFLLSIGVLYMSLSHFS